MSKKDFQKRMGQIYALALQHGLNEEDIMQYVNEAFLFLYSPKRQEEIRGNILKTSYTEDRYKIINT